MSLDRSVLCKELTVTNKIFETPDTASFVLALPADLKEKFKYKAGQFVTFFMDINGEEVRRSYSLASAPNVDSDFKVTVKRVPGGKGSNFLLDKVSVGQKLWTTPPAGHFVLPNEYSQFKLVFFAAGSGITPIISIIKSALHTNSTVQCALYFQNREENGIIFKNELEEIQKQFCERFICQHILSQPSANWSGEKGRVEKNLIRDFLAKNLIGIKAVHFICGPEGFMKVIERSLADLGVDNSQIRRESFSSPVELSTEMKDTPSSVKVDEDAILIGDSAAQSQPADIEAVFDSKTVIIKADGKKTILECLLEAGHNPPYSCMDGACMACLAKVDKGLVYQNDLGILTEDNVAAKECLTCQARPLSKNVKVNFDTY